MLFDKNRMDALLKYKFNGLDRSLLYYHCSLKYWDRILNVIPKWVAPNAITLMGFIAMFIQTGCVLYADPNLLGGKKWLPMISAIVMWFYSTMDCIDGMQARKTGAKSPLGQLFDHGVDSVVCTFIMLCISSAIGLKNKKTVFFLLASAQTIFYWVTSKEYYTHLFYLGLIGPTEAIAIGCIFLLVLSIVGREKVLHPTVWISNNLDLIIQGVCFLIWAIGTVYYIVDIWISTKFGITQDMSFLQKNMILWPHVLFVLLQVLSVLSVVTSNSINLNTVFYSYISICTVCFSLFTTLIIFSHQTASPIEIPSLIIFLAAMANLSIVFVSAKKISLVITVLNAISVLYYLSYVTNIIDGYLTTLRIPFFFNNC
ncbi:ethanolaminephosphotransferase [Nematocida minor]|uniref:ethanolaminephosphotransferase n=1 Tax=Nematocida minor TaxID=1912983 RepID=UPI002220ED0A|nr:ethanolaminephosphotransferase [Nematocida minor]KAI5190284.1 ethanolaminephosphotransferase [Nematocida minor]